MMKLIIAGSRSWYDYNSTKNIIEKVLLDNNWEPTEIVSGCASGVDHNGEIWATRKGIAVKGFPAQWHEFGRAAGPVRNQEMAEYADALLALPGSTSRGTWDMVERMRSLGKPVVVKKLTDRSVVQ
jgi:hypothetical protein